MWPSLYSPTLQLGPVHTRSLAISQAVLSDGPVDDDLISFDFDMLIAKGPHTATEVPWHQDEAYWRLAGLDFEDLRATSCWVALDQATVDNGCMWFVPTEAIDDIIPHEPVKAGEHVLQAMPSSLSPEYLKVAVPVELQPGSCTFHSGRTLHRTLGNSTASRRRALITNHRPWSMVQYERDNGFDHGRGGLEGIHPSVES